MLRPCLSIRKKCGESEGGDAPAIGPEKILHWVREPVLALDCLQIHSPLVKIPRIGAIDILAFI